MASAPSAKAAAPARLDAGTAAWIAAAIAFLAFVPALHGGFVYDDHRFLESNPHLASPSILWRAFADPVCQTANGTHAGLWRPLRTLSFAFDRLVFGAAAWGPHLVNVALHAAGTALVARLLSLWRLPATAALLGAAVYALHPVQTECVAWISSRGDLLAAALVWGALLADGRGRSRLSLALGAAALLSKEQAVVWPALVVLSRVLGGGRWRDALRAARLPLGVTVAFVVVRHLLLAEPLQEGGLGHGAPGIAVLAGMLAHQTWVLAFPAGLALDWQMPWLAHPPAAATVVALAVVAGLFWRPSRAPLAWFLAAIAPTWALQAFVPLNILVADRFLLFALPALALVVARAAAAHRGVAVACLAATLCLGTLTEAAIPRWRSDAVLWASVVGSQPDNPRALTWLGDAMLRDGRFAEAEDVLLRAVARAPEEATARYDLAVAQESVARATNPPDEERLTAALVGYHAAVELFRAPRAEGAAERVPCALWAQADLLLLLGRKELAREAISGLLDRPATAAERDAGNVRRCLRLADRVEAFLDPALAARIRARFGGGAAE